MADLLTPATVQASLRRHGITPSRALGQNFLVDPNTARRIVRLAEIPTNATVVEIGPGLGSLTLALVETGARVIAVELDRHILAPLREHLAGAPVTIVEGNALTIEWDALFDEHRAGRVVLVANLPYNIATPVIVRVLETTDRVDSILVMVQREVGERLAADPRTKAYGAVTVKTAFHARAEVVGLVPPTVFVPKPNVESALVRLVPHPTPPVSVADPEAMFALVRAGFSTRRKMLRQSLKASLGDATVAMLDAAGIEPTARAEELVLEDWARLAGVVG
jgi:16S rRNA (adenine1518-N6/adenine1519-N6)-dimethyltransferase